MNAMSDILPDDVIWKLWEQSISDATDCEFTRLSHIAAFAKAAITADRSAREGEAVAWQWRRKGTPWSLDKTFNTSVFATTPDTEVRALYTAPADRAAVVEAVAPLNQEQIADCVTRIKPYPMDLVVVPAEQLIAFTRNIEQLLAAPADRGVAEWQDIETAPHRFSPPLSTVNHHAPDILGLWGQAFYCVCSWGGPDRPYWIGSDNKRVPFQPTRWMPLPAAPTHTKG